MLNGNPKVGGRQLLIFRHGERIDFTFNPTEEDWMKKAFDKTGNYRRFNLNMPRTVPHRKDGFSSYDRDSPLTEIGYLQAKLSGRALKEADVKPTYAYSSPAYRCVQTCAGIIRGLSNKHLMFNIEPGLFEWGQWFRPRLPTWMYPEEFVAQGYPVDVTYTPIMPARDGISVDETVHEYYERSHRVVRTILDRHQDEDCCIILVGHAASLDACSRLLCGKEPPSHTDYYAIIRATPYLANACVREDPTGAWKICEPPVLPLQQMANHAYNWHVHDANDEDVRMSEFESRAV